MAKLELELLIKDSQAANSVGDIRKQLKELKSAMLTVGEDSEEFNQLAQAAAKLKDRVEEANEKISAMNPDKFKGLSTMASGAATGIQLVTSSMALLGVESEDAQKVMMKVQAAMAFSQAINDIDKLKKGFKELGDTIRANPIMAFATALTALGIALYNVYKAQQDANSELAKATREYEKQKEVTATLSREYERQIGLLTAQGASEEDIIKVKRDLIKVQMLELQQGIEMHEAKLKDIKDNDNLWESIIKVSAAVNGGAQNQINADIAIAENKKERAKEELDALNEQKESLKDLEYALKELDAEETQIADKKKEQNIQAYNDKKALKDQEALDNQAAWDKALEDNQAFLDALNQQEQEHTDMVAEHNQHRVEMYKESEEAKYKAWKRIDDQRKAAEKAAQKREQMINDWRIDSIKSTLSIASELFKNNANAQKAISAATTLVDTYVAAQKAYVSQIIPLDPSSVVRAQVAAGLAIVSGLARVAAIMRVDTSGASASSGGGSAGMSGGGSLSVSSQPNVSSGSQPSTLLTEQGNVMNQQSQNPIYVSVQEIRETGQVVETIEERSRF